MFSIYSQIGDGLSQEWGGVEEVTTVALLQRLRPKTRAVLVKFMYHHDNPLKTDIENLTNTSNNNVSSNDCIPIENSKTKSIESEHMTISWDTDFKNDPIRIAYHMKKMISKDSRPMKQLQHLGLDIDNFQAVVHHKVIYI